MTKLEIAQQLSVDRGMTVGEAILIIDSLCTIAKDAFAEGKNIYLRGFGTFNITRRNATTVRNIKMQRSYIYPAHNIVTFKPSKSLIIKQ